MHLLRGAVKGKAADIGRDQVDVAGWHSDEARVGIGQSLVVDLQMRKHRCSEILQLHRDCSSMSMVF